MSLPNSSPELVSLKEAIVSEDFQEVELLQDKIFRDCTDFSASTFRKRVLLSLVVVALGIVANQLLALQWGFLVSAFGVVLTVWAALKFRIDRTACMRWVSTLTFDAIEQTTDAELPYTPTNGTDLQMLSSGLEIENTENSLLLKRRLSLLERWIRH